MGAKTRKIKKNIRKNGRKCSWYLPPSPHTTLYIMTASQITYILFPAINEPQNPAAKHAFRQKLQNDFQLQILYSHCKEVNYYYHRQRLSLPPNFVEAETLEWCALVSLYLVKRINEMGLIVQNFAPS